MPLYDHVPPSMLSTAHSCLFFSVYWSQNVMAGCWEHHHPSKNTKSPLTVVRIEKRRRQLGFNHIQKMIPYGHVKRKIHIDPKEVSLAFICSKRRSCSGASSCWWVLAMNSRWFLSPWTRGKSITNWPVSARPQVAHLLPHWITCAFLLEYSYKQLSNLSLFANCKADLTVSMVIGIK